MSDRFEDERRLTPDRGCADPGRRGSASRARRARGKRDAPEPDARAEPTSRTERDARASTRRPTTEPDRRGPSGPDRTSTDLDLQTEPLADDGPTWSAGMPADDTPTPAAPPPPSRPVGERRATADGVRPGEPPSGEVPPLPHWTEPPTGAVPAIFADGERRPTPTSTRGAPAAPRRGSGPRAPTGPRPTSPTTT